MRSLRPLPLSWLISKNAALQCYMAQSLTVDIRNNINRMWFSLFLFNIAPRAFAGPASSKNYLEKDITILLLMLPVL